MDGLKLVVGQITPLGEPHHFLIGEVTATVLDTIKEREVSHNLTLRVRVPYRSDATLQEVQKALRAKAASVLAEISAANLV